MSDESRRKVPVKWIIALGAVVLVGVLVYSSMQQSRYRYRVCVTFNGQTHCAMAAGANADEAIRSAQEIDCSQLANGRDQNMVCLATSPSDVQAIAGESSSTK